MFKTIVAKNIFYMTLVQISNYVVPLVTLPFLARVIGVEGVGSVAILLSVCSIGFIVTDYGFAISSPVWIAQHKEDKEKISEYLSCVFVIKLILGFLFSLLFTIYFITSKKYPNINSSVILIIFFIVFFQSLQVTWLFQGLEKMKNITLCTVTAKVTYLFFVIFLVNKYNGVFLTLVCFLVSNIIAAALSLFLIYREGLRLHKVKTKLIKKIFVLNTSFFVSRVAVSIYSSASTFIVGSFAGIQQAALYSGAEKLYQGAISVSSPINQALYPHLAKTRDITLLLRFVFILVPIMAICASGAIFYSKDIIILIYGVDFAAAEHILDIFIVVACISFISINFGYPAFSTIGRLDVVNKSVLWGAGVQLINLIVLYFFDNITALNVVYGILLTESFILIFRLVSFLKLYKK